MTFYLSEEQFAELFKEHPQVRKAETGMPCCPYCSNALSPENMEYYNGATEYGTPYTNLEITCDVCNKVIWRYFSWYPGVEYPEELQYVVEGLAEAIVDGKADAE